MSELHDSLKNVIIDLPSNTSVNLYTLITQIKEGAREWLSELGKNGYEHSLRLEGYLDSLTKNIRKKDLITPEEVFVLLCAVYMHDIGYIGGKEGHATRSREMILGNTVKYLLGDFPKIGGKPPRIAQAVGTVCKGHVPMESPLHEIPHDFTDMIFPHPHFDLRKLTALLCLADEADDPYYRRGSLPTAPSNTITLVEIKDPIIIWYWERMGEENPHQFREYVDGKNSLLEPAIDYLTLIGAGKWYLVIDPQVMGDIGKEPFPSRLYYSLKPIDFTSEIKAYSDRFYGREWLFPEINRWLEHHPRSRIFWLSGDPGIGKTAIASRLCSDRTDIIAFHFFKYGHEDKSSTKRAVLSIVYQMAQQLPEYAERLRNINLEEEVKKGSQTLFDNLIVQPLAGEFPNPGHACLILLDAIDEAEKDGQNEMADIIRYQWEKTPPWLKLVILSRPESSLLHLKLLSHLEPYKLDAGRTENYQDISEYLQQELEKRGIPFTPGQIQKIRDNSAGIFLYVVEALKEIDANGVPLETIIQWPQGMYGLYEISFKRKFLSKKMYNETVRPILACICAQRDPLPYSLLARATTMSEWELDQQLDQIRSFFPSSARKGEKVESRTIFPFHKSIFDWLTTRDPETGYCNAGTYSVDIIQGQRQLAEACWDDYSNFNTISPYSLRHLPAHLVECGNGSKYTSLMHDFRFIQLKVKTFGPYDMISDYELGNRLTSLPMDDTHSLSLIQNALIRSSHVISKDSDQLAAQLIGRLLSFKEPGIKQFIVQMKIGLPVPALFPINAALLPPGGSLLRTLEGHTSIVTAVAVTPDGKRAVSASDDSTLRVWDIATGAIIVTFSGDEGINDCTFADNGRNIVAGGSRGMVYILLLENIH